VGADVPAAELDGCENECQSGTGIENNEKKSAVIELYIERESVCCVRTMNIGCLLKLNVLRRKH
jgi:hypothetical protein